MTKEWPSSRIEYTKIASSKCNYKYFNCRIFSLKPQKNKRTRPLLISAVPEQEPCCCDQYSLTDEHLHAHDQQGQKVTMVLISYKTHILTRLRIHFSDSTHTLKSANNKVRLKITRCKLLFIILIPNSPKQSKLLQNFQLLGPTQGSLVQRQPL